jgi:segregation and condensation protein B
VKFIYAGDEPVLGRIDGDFLKQVIEAIIFASDVPITAKQIHALAEEVSPSQIEKIIQNLNLEYTQTKRAFHIVKIAGGYQLVSRDSFSPWIQKLFQGRRKSRLSQAALETLSLIVFKQPVSKTEVSAIRGVNCDGVIQTLLERKLITISGRSDGPGRPLIFRTTNEFLRYFGVNDISDLPRPREMEEILKEEGNLPESSTE